MCNFFQILQISGIGQEIIVNNGEAFVLGKKKPNKTAADKTGATGD
jgi:hypothetical protein